MIEASPSRCTPEHWTAEQAARAMGVVDEADVEALGVEGAASGEIGMAGAVGREEPSARGGMRWVAGGAAIAVVAAAAWWSGAGSGDSWEIPVHEGTYGALIAGERTPNLGPGVFNSSNGSSHMKIQTTAAAALLGAAASTFQAQAGDAVQWRVEDGGNGHWYQLVIEVSGITWPEARQRAAAVGGSLAVFSRPGSTEFVQSILSGAMCGGGTGQAGPYVGGFQDLAASDYSEPSGGWRWVDGSPFPGSAVISLDDNLGHQDYVSFLSLQPSCSGPFVLDDVGLVSNANRSFIVEWSADCNADNIVDYGQIISGQLADTNTNGIPDICECATHPELGACRCVGDIVTDGIVNGADLGTLLAYWGLTTSAPYSQASDINVDGRVDGADLGRLLSNWGACQYQGVTVPAWATLIEALPDPAVVTDPALRTGIAATGLAWRVRDTGTGIEVLLVPPGIFDMGCSASQQYECFSSENPQHSVTLTQAFYIGRFEVTQQQWQEKMGSNPSDFQGYQDSPSRPVEHVSWDQVQGYLSGTGLRMPTESEWEYACRGGTSTAFPNGSNDDNSVESIAWYSVNSESQPHAVGGKAANAFGLHDMLGNVWEWVSDWYGPYPTEPQTNPQGPTSGPYREIRGGAYIHPTDFVRSSYRGYATADNPGLGVGFRVVRNP